MTDDDAALGAAIDHVKTHRYDLHYEEIDPAFFRRIFELYENGLQRGRRQWQGMTLHAAWSFAVSERYAAALDDGQPCPRWLLEMVALRMIEQQVDQRPGFRARPSRWVREVLQPAYDQAQITTLTKRFEAQGAHNPRVRAEERYAKRLRLSVDALRKRRRRLAQKG